MSGTFSSLGTALSALRYHRVAMDVASGNIANATTEGYVRRRAEAVSVGAPAIPAMWSRYDGAGDGVASGGLTRLADPFLDARARREHSSQSYLDTRQSVLERVESGLGEPGDTGVSAALNDFRQSWQNLVNNPGNDAARAQVLAAAGTLANGLQLQSRNISTEEADQRGRLQSIVSEVNTLASDLADANRAVAVATLNGDDAGVVLDRRDQLALRLSELTGAVATPRTDGGLDVTLNGVALVTGQNAGILSIATGVTPTGGADGNPVTWAITDTSGTTPVAGLMGETGAVTDLLNTTLPAYRSGLDTIAVTLANQVNTQHALGYDATGTPGTALFGFDPADPAGSLAVAISDPSLLAVSSVAGGGLDAGNAEALTRATTVEGDYQRLVNGLGTEVASVRRLAANQATITAQVDGSREQLSGVNLDEEMVSMLSSQRAYEAAARVMTTIDSVLDTLINRTGLVR